jgi:hypothetical protein
MYRYIYSTFETMLLYSILVSTCMCGLSRVISSAELFCHKTHWVHILQVPVGVLGHDRV